MAHKKPTTSRRDFLQSTGRMATVSVLLAAGIAGYTRQATALPAAALRPPGALPEEDFAAACIRCGLCVNDCPYPTLSLANMSDAPALGTPFFTAREAACEMCDDIPCVVACPTGALDHALTDINQAKMGLARVVDTDGCIAFQGLRCEVCFNVCPIRGKAITLELSHNERSGKHAIFAPVVHDSDCTGCGKCEEACIMEEATIKVLPHKLALGKMQAHYRLGWKEKQKAGKSLVAPDIKHKYNLPEGQRYEYGGEGLIKDTPFGNNPLDTLNKSDLIK